MFKERFSVVYTLTGNKKDAYEKAKDICLEQTVEIPDSLVPDNFIREHILGRRESFHKIANNRYKTVISYAIENIGNEFTQLLNTLFGNISIKPGIRIEEMRLSPSILKSFKGPRFGRNGLRRLLDVKKRPLLCTPLKPLGLSSKELSELAYQLALGGIDIIKDDHGIADQSFSPFEQRVRLCAKAVQKANKKTGYSCIYVPNITSHANQIFKKVNSAKRHGAGGLMIAPGIVGLDTMRQIAEDDSIGLPIFSHPALQGTYVINKESGISHYALFGQIARLAGTDAVIYPNFGGRFSFTKEECREIIDGTGVKMGSIKPIFPCPGGGINLKNVPDLIRFYGNDVIFLIGGSLFSHDKDLVEACRHFHKIVGINC